MKTEDFRIRPRMLLFVAVLAGFALLVPASTFAESDAYAAAVTVKPIVVTSVTGNGMPIEYPDTDKEEVTVAEVILNPGAETGWHTHASPVYAYVLSGTLAVDYVDGTGKVFATGEAIIEVVNTPHNGRTVGAEQVRLIVFYLGIKGKPNSVKVPAPER